jgi:hypothetical protein
VIVTSTAPTGTAPVEWMSLARRGMLFSEVQVFDLLAGGPGPV